MLTDAEKRDLAQALVALKEGSAAAWGAISPLARAARTAEISIDMSATEAVGVPIIIVTPRQSPPALPLTRRQAEVAHLIAGGLSNKEVARTLGIAVATVKDHVHAILSALDVAGRAAVARRVFGAETSDGIRPAKSIL